MHGAFRFWTDCLTGIRHWRWYARVGRPDRALVWPCTKLAALGLPLLIGPALPPFFVPPPIVEEAAPWVPFGAGLYEFGSGFGGGYGGGAFLPAYGGYGFPQGGALHAGPAVSAGVGPADVGALPAPAASGGIPLTSLPDTPVPTPEPASWAVLLVGLVVLVVGRKSIKLNGGK